MKTRLAIAFLLSIFATPLFADGPADNNPETVRKVPRDGIEVSAADRAAINKGLDQLAALISQLHKRRDARTVALLPDVEIFHRGVSDNLDYREFFAKGDISQAKELLRVGAERAAALLKGEAPWTTQTGLVVRGYRSKLDGSAQPYGLVVPASFRAVGQDRFRCDIWFHGRGETLSETKFIAGRMKQVGQYAPRDTFVLHPYGRYSNAFKFGGEVDTLEALAHVENSYRIDKDRISVRGFSMGGAACWQFAVHYPDRWFAANPGAGFSETPLFLDVFQKETLNPKPWERTLWSWYDCPGYAINLGNCPTVAYSGEIDRQKQAADVMEDALAKVGIDMVHIIGPKTGHRIHPDSKKIIEAKMSSLAAVGRERMPRQVRLATYTLKYNRMHWLTIDALAQHWKQSQVDAETHRKNRVDVTTKNVNALTFAMPTGECPFNVTSAVKIVIDGQELKAPRPKSDRSWHVSLVKSSAGWKVGGLPENGLRKRHGLQGPIDDALMESFLFVRPSGKARHAAVEKWTHGELDHAIVHWRQHFRGHARVTSDTDVTDADIAAHNLILWGDPASNRVLAKIADRLPIQWDAEKITVGKRTFDAKTHAAILVFPNPLNPQRYVALNSSFTYREYAYLNNARQVPTLPDWAVIDLRTPPGSQFPGKVVAADFFDESWCLK
jgi:hypothetical protein